MKLDVKQTLFAISATLVFIQGGITQLPIDDAYKAFAVFGVGAMVVFLQNLLGAAQTLTAKVTRKPKE